MGLKADGRDNVDVKGVKQIKERRSLPPVIKKRKKD